MFGGIGGLFVVPVFGSNLNPELKPPIRCVRNTNSETLAPVNRNRHRDADPCVICLEDDMRDPVRITTCQHVFCRECIATWLAENPACPVCKKPITWYTGNQPPGTMRVRTVDQCMEGFRAKTIVMRFHIPAGFAAPTGRAHGSMLCVAYLPDTEEGQHCMKLIRAAFRQRLLFKLEGANIVPNSIELKTSIRGLAFDPTYFVRLREDLSKVGIV